VKPTPSWPLAVGVYLAYITIIFATWWAVGANYADLASEGVVLKSMLLPLGLGAVFVALAVTWLGWWRPATTETTRAQPRWALWVIVVMVLGFVCVNASVTHWSALSPTHLAMLVGATLLVGFNEELVTRGVLVAGLRGSSFSELQVWFWSSLLFGAMHVPNALFGLPWVAGLAQGVFAFLMGAALYVLRRVSGSLLVPMLLHAAWDFSSLSMQASKAATSPLTFFAQFGTYLVAVIAVVAVLRRERSRREAAA